MQAPTKVAIYTRKSNEDKQRPGKSVHDQLVEARDEAVRRGWEIAAELGDEVSASRHSRKDRPGFERLLSLIEGGEVGAVIVAEQSRLVRRLSVLGRLLESCADNGVVLVLGSTQVDPSQPEGLLMSGVQGTMDMVEAERIRKRIMRGQRHAALAGRPGGHTPWGYRRVFDSTTKAFIRQEPDPGVVPTIRAAVDALLAGHSLRSVALRYSPTGDDKNFKARLLSPSLAGHRIMNGVIVARDAWPPIVTDAEQDRIRRLFPGKERIGARRHLLSGIAQCSECGAGMRAHLRRDKPRRYYCNAPDCHAVTILADPLDEYATTAVIARLSKPESLAMIAARPEDEHAVEAAELAVQRQRLDELAVEVANGSMSARLAGQAEAVIVSRIAELERAMRPRGLPPELVDLLRGDVEATWGRLTIEQRVTVMRAMVKVIVRPSTRPRGTNGFDKERVLLDWV